MQSTDFDADITAYVKARAPLILFIFNTAGRVEEAGAQSALVCGENTVGKSFAEIFAQVPDGKSFEDWRPPDGEESNVDLQLPSRPAQTWKLIFRKRGERVLAIGRRDTGEIEGMELNLLSLNAELSNRTRELYQSNAELERLNTLKNRFLGIAAHDLRTPLGIIFGFSELLKAEAPESMAAEHRMFISTIQSNSEYMLALVNDLLDVATIESGKLNLKRTPVDLPAILAENLARNQVLAARKNIRLVFDPPLEFPEVSLDRMKFEQVMNNLLGNAIKFSGKDTTTTVRLAQGTDHAKISVSDEGPGIPADKVDQIGQPFARLGTPASESESGTGLGLLIAKKIVEGHGGSLRLDTTVKSGTTFILELPLRVTNGKHSSQW